MNCFVAFVTAQPLELLHVSVVTSAEIRFGIDLVSDAGRRAELNGWLAHRVRPMFQQREFAITEDIMLNGGYWSRMAARCATPSRNPIS
jgi:toxin FitB